MFSKSNTAQSTTTDISSAKPSVTAVPSIISQDLTVRGDLISEGEIQIDGTIHGDIVTVTLLVGETAEINGEIKANRARVHGQVNGQTTADSVTLAETAHVEGDIIYDELSMEKGAYLEGYCRPMESRKAEVAAKENAEPIPLKPQGDGTSAIKEVEKPSNTSA